MKTLWTFEGTEKEYITKEHAERAAAGAKVYEVQQEEPKRGASFEELRAELRSAPLNALESAADALKPKSWR